MTTSKVWTVFVSDYLPSNIDECEYDFVYMNCNTICAQMFMKQIFGDDVTHYELSDTSDTPYLENVKIYSFGSSTLPLYCRVFTVEELQKLGLVGDEPLYRNLLVGSY